MISDLLKTPGGHVLLGAMALLALGLVLLTIAEITVRKTQRKGRVAYCDALKERNTVFRRTFLLSVSTFCYWWLQPYAGMLYADLGDFQPLVFYALMVLLASTVVPFLQGRLNWREFSLFGATAALDDDSETAKARAQLLISEFCRSVCELDKDVSRLRTELGEEPGLIVESVVNRFLGEADLNATFIYTPYDDLSIRLSESERAGLVEGAFCSFEDAYGKPSLFTLRRVGGVAFHFRVSSDYDILRVEQLQQYLLQLVRYAAMELECH